MTTFTQMGFAPPVKASSATPDTDGYIAEFNGHPYHIHPIATPEQWEALQAAIADNSITPEPYQAPVVSLADAKTTQLYIIENAYSEAIQKDVSYTTVGSLTQTFQANSESQTILLQALTGYQLVDATPPGFFWLASDNTKVPFTLTDLKGLYGVMLDQGFTAFGKKTTLKDEIRKAETVDSVQAVVW